MQRAHCNCIILYAHRLCTFCVTLLWSVPIIADNGSRRGFHNSESIIIIFSSFFLIVIIIFSPFPGIHLRFYYRFLADMTRSSADNAILNIVYASEMPNGHRENNNNIVKIQNFHLFQADVVQRCGENLLFFQKKKKKEKIINAFVGTFRAHLQCDLSGIPKYIIV